MKRKMLNLYVHDYLEWIIFCFISIFLIALLFIISTFFSAASLNFDSEKLSIYECGFDPFGSIRKKFDIKYYIIAILFIIFDLEIILLLPWIFVYKITDFYMFSILMVFLIILVIGFVYEWKNRALEWQ